jgi:hypothetical protein
MSAVVEACLSAKEKLASTTAFPFKKGGNYLTQRFIAAGGPKLEYHRRRQFFGLSIT